MKAIVAHAAKDLRIETHDMPTPGPGEVLIRLERGGICGSDLHYYNHGGFGTVRLREPMILGSRGFGSDRDLCRRCVQPDTGRSGRGVAVAALLCLFRIALRDGTITASTCGFMGRPCRFRIFRARFGNTSSQTPGNAPERKG